MPRFSQGIRLALACSLIAIGIGKAHAARPTESLLPATSKGFLSIGNVEEFRASFNRTQLGQLIKDPVMKPFADDFVAQLTRKWTQSHDKLGISWEDLDGLATGEVGVALVQPSETEVALVLLVDVTGHEAQVDELLEKISGKMAERGATRSQRSVDDTTITLYDIPKSDDMPARQAALLVKDGVLAASDDLKVLEDVLARFDDSEADRLATVPAFAAVMKRCQAADEDLKPGLRWFVEPFGYLEAMRVANPSMKPHRGTDLLKIFKNQGFTAVQGAGGFVNFATDNYEMLHRTAIYAPPVKEGAERYELAAQMLDLPNGKQLDPLPWIPREVATFARFNVNLRGAFEASKTLVDEIVGEEVFDEILLSIAEDPNGPQIDLRNELVAHLGNRVTLISDYQLPITPKSERMLVAAEATNEAALAATIDRFMSTDPDARRWEYGEHVIWEIIDEQTPPLMVNIENNPAFGAPLPGQEMIEEEQPEERRALPNSAVTVAYGHLLVATHVDFLVKILTKVEEGEKLSDCTDYQIVRRELEKVQAAENCVQTFSRTDEEYRAVYELVRTGRMPEAETMLGKLLNAVLGEGKEGVLRHQRVDGSMLPDFETVRRYFGPAGLTVTSEPDGWFITGFTLTKDSP